MITLATQTTPNVGLASKPLVAPNPLPGSNKAISQMMVDDFLAFEEVFVQRDTVPRALKANKSGGHLEVYDPDWNHDAVALGYHVEHKKWYRIDGNQRAFLWSAGKLERPSFLTVTWRYCKTVKELETAYKSYDSSDSAKNRSDQIYSEMAKNNIRLKTPMLKKDTWIVFGNLYLADLPNTEKYTPRSHFGDEDFEKSAKANAEAFAFLDSLNLKKSKKSEQQIDAGIIVGAVLAYRYFYGSTHARDILAEFLDRYHKGSYVQTRAGSSNKIDMVGALALQGHTKKVGSSATGMIIGGWERAEVKASRFLWCFLNYYLDEKKMIVKPGAGTPNIGEISIRGFLR